MGKIKKCTACNTYTMQTACPGCDAATERPGPPTFSPADRHGEHRRQAKTADSEE